MLVKKEEELSGSSETSQGSASEIQQERHETNRHTINWQQLESIFNNKKRNETLKHKRKTLKQFQQAKTAIQRTLNTKIIRANPRKRELNNILQATQAEGFKNLCKNQRTAKPKQGTARQT
jgi:hypothetical protein